MHLSRLHWQFLQKLYLKKQFKKTVNAAFQSSTKTQISYSFLQFSSWPLHNGKSVKNYKSQPMHIGQKYRVLKLLNGTKR